MRFGKLVALRRVGGNGMCRWLCVCDCGNTTEVYTTNLINNRTKSCGCFRRSPQREKSVNEVGNALLKETLFEGVRLSYSVHGSGIPVVFIPGFFQDKTFWTRFMELLTDCRAVAMDMRGCGGTVCSGQFTVADMAEDLHQVMSGVGMPKAHIVTFDTGSVIAHEFARMYPHKVLSMTMISPVVGDYSRLNLLFTRIVDGVFSSECDLQMMSDTLNILWSYSSKEGYRPRVHTIPEKAGPLGLKLYLKAIRDYGPVKGYHYAMPTQIIRGREDPLLDDEELKKFAGCTGSVLISLDNEGHIPSASSCMRKAMSFSRSNDG